MSSGCLGELNSNSMDLFVDHEYDIIPPSIPDTRTATLGYFEILMVYFYHFQLQSASF
jgi:hypothetical protein